eukprot:COSAG02_NODE_4731_length_5043_cov_3.579895_6_plen_44_part_00
MLSPELNANGHENRGGTKATLVYLLGQPRNSQEGDAGHQYSAA